MRACSSCCTSKVACWVYRVKVQTCARCVLPHCLLPNLPPICFAHRVVREIGALSAAVGGLNVLAFTGGIGEHDALLRAQVAHALGHMGVSVDTERNQQATGDAVCAIHDSSSRVEVWVVPTDEGRVAAQEALAITRKPS